MSVEIDAFTAAPVFEAAESPYLVIDRQLRICAANPAYESVIGHPRTLLRGEQLFDVFPDNPGDPDADGVANLSESLERVLRTGARHRMTVQRYDVRVRSMPGAFVYKVWAPVNSPIRDDRGRTVAVLHHVEDITDFFPPDGPRIASPGQVEWAALLADARHQHQLSQELRRQVETLREALDTNRQISVAIGLVMAATGVGRDAAFQLLLKQSQTSNRKLRDIATELVSQHEKRIVQALVARPSGG